MHAICHVPTATHTGRTHTAAQVLAAHSSAPCCLQRANPAQRSLAAKVPNDKAQGPVNVRSGCARTQTLLSCKS
jgi:hypothetical protein